MHHAASGRFGRGVIAVELSIRLAPSTSAAHTSLPPRVTISRVWSSTSSSRACEAPTAIGASPPLARTGACAVVEFAVGIGDDDGVDCTDEGVADRMRMRMRSVEEPTDAIDKPIKP